MSASGLRHRGVRDDKLCFPGERRVVINAATTPPRAQKLVGTRCTQKSGRISLASFTPLMMFFLCLTLYILRVKVQMQADHQRSAGGPQRLLVYRLGVRIDATVRHPAVVWPGLIRGEY